MRNAKLEGLELLADNPLLKYRFLVLNGSILTFKRSEGYYHYLYTLYVLGSRGAYLYHTIPDAPYNIQNTECSVTPGRRGEGRLVTVRRARNRGEENRRFA